MKIVYCVPSMYRLGGVERIVAKKASLLAKRGFDVFIITTDQGERPCYFEIDDKVKFMIWVLITKKIVNVSF